MSPSKQNKPMRNALTSTLSTRTLVSVGTALCLLAGAAVAESPVSWLMRLNDDAQRLSYRGSFVYNHGNQVEAMRIVRRASDNGVLERLVSLSGASREIIRDDRQVWCYLPDENRGVHQGREFGKRNDAGFPSILPESVTDLQQFYEFKLGETARVAQRVAQRVDIFPIDAYRYGRMLWIDSETGLLLRADLIDTSGKAVEQYMFVEVEYSDEIQDSELAPSTPDQDLVWHKPAPALRSMDKSVNWSAQKRPDGFRLIEYMRKPGADETEQVHHLVYGDGLSTVSVFVDPTKSGSSEHVTGASHMGGVNVFGVERDGVQITAIGEVPQATVRLLADAMMRQ